MLVTKRLLVQVSLGTGHFVIFLSLPFPSPSLPSQRNFPISFKPKVAIAEFFWKMQKKSGIMKSGLYARPLFLLDDLLKNYLGRQPRRLLRPRQHFLRKSSVSFQRAAQPRPSCVSPKATGSSDLYSPSHSISG